MSGYIFICRENHARLEQIQGRRDLYEGLTEAFLCPPPGVSVFCFCSLLVFVNEQSANHWTGTEAGGIEG